MEKIGENSRARVPTAFTINKTLNVAFSSLNAPLIPWTRRVFPVFDQLDTCVTTSWMFDKYKRSA